MTGRTTVRGLVALTVMAAMVGPAAAMTPAADKLPPLPAVRGTVRDQCTGNAVPAFRAALVDDLGQSVPPTTTNQQAFRFDAVTAARYHLQISAPGYQPLDDPGDPGAGIPLSMPPGAKNPGPPTIGEKNPGPIGLDSGGRVGGGLRVATLLMPAAGCAGRPKVLPDPDVVGRLVDVTTGEVVPGATVDYVGKQPGPVQLPLGSTGRFAVGQMVPAADRQGPGALHVHAPGYADLDLGVMVQPPLSSPNGSASVTNTLAIGMMSAINHPPVIVSTSLSATQFQSSSTITLHQVSFDPDVADNALLQVNWTAKPPFNTTCTFNPVPPHGFSTDLTCTGAGSVQLDLHVGDLHGHVVTKTHIVTVTAPSP